MSSALPLPLPKLSNLLPRRAESAATGGNGLHTQLQALRNLTWLQWALFFSGWLAWMCDGLDFISVSLTVLRLTEEFDQSVKSVTTAITLTLLLRSVGALIFGLISDQFGRKWPLVANLLIIAALELGAGFSRTFEQFLVLRALFGIAMGGIWGMASSTALENLPAELRGLASGVVQQGFAIGYLIAGALSISIVPQYGWRYLFYAASAVSFFAAIFRAMLPESRIFLVIKEAKAPRRMKRKFWLREAQDMLKKHWKLFTYAVVLMSGFNFLSHGSQDLYTTFLETSKLLTPREALIATIIGNCGAIVGGTISGLLSQYLGRRLTIILNLILAGLLIPLWILPNSFGALSAGFFLLQFAVGGAWGVVPIQLAEISPPASRATFGGVTYQIGNMVSSASAQIEAAGGEHLHKIMTKDGVSVIVPDYGTIQGVFIGAVVVFLIMVASLGPERHGSNFEVERTRSQSVSIRTDRTSTSQAEKENKKPDANDIPLVVVTEVP